MKLKAAPVFFGLCLIFFPVWVWADAVVSLGEASGGAGAEVIVSVKLLSNPENVAAMNFTVQFDAEKLDFVSAAAAEMLTRAGKEIKANPPGKGCLKIVIYGMNTNVIPNGTIAEITFAVKSDVKKDSVLLDLHSLVAYSGDCRPVDSREIDASVKCSGGESGKKCPWWKFW